MTSGWLANTGTLLTIAALILGCSACAVRPDFVDAEGQNILALDAVELAKATVIDVRSVDERHAAPSRPGWIAVQYGASDWNDSRIEMVEEKVEFAQKVAAAVGQDYHRTIMVICQYGVRSTYAARVLRLAGFQDVRNVLDGMKGNTLGHGWEFAERW